MSTVTPDTHGRPRGRALLAALLSTLLAVTLGVATPSSAAAAPSGAQVSISAAVPATSPATQPIGNGFQYRIDYTCSDCTSVQISIPLGAAEPFSFQASQNLQLFPHSLVAGNLIIDVGAVNGSFTLTLDTLAPVGPTADGTTWTFTPTIIADTLAPVTSTSSVTGTYTAGFDLEFDKAGPPNLLLVGDTFDFVLNLDCVGRYADTVTISDPLPAGLEFVSASHGGTYANGVVTWDLTGDEVGGTCGAPAQNLITVTVKATAAVLGGASSVDVTNTATVDAVSLDGGTASAEASDTVTILGETTYPVGSFIKSMDSEGGLHGDQAYAGQEVSILLRSLQPRDGYRGSAIDPIPCRTNLSGTTYASLPGGAVCTDPLIAVTRIGTSAGTTVPAGWAPQVRLTDGSVQTLTAGWNTPAGVAEVIIPEVPFPNASDSLEFYIYGTLTTDIAAGSTVRNDASGTIIYPDDTATSRTSSDSIRVIDDERMGASKNIFTDSLDFETPYGVVASGWTQTRSPLSADVVLTDLLPAGHYVRADLPQRVIIDRDANWVTLNAPIEVIDDFNGTGRQLVRARIPAAELNALVTDWSVPPVVLTPSLRFSVQAPGPGLFDNTSQLFYTDAAAALGCVQGSVLYQDVDDLDGNPATTQACSETASQELIAAPRNTGFLVLKAVQGDLDTGYASGTTPGRVSGDGAAAKYLLTWTNLTAEPIDDPVIYDVLPRSGDTRVSSTDARNSEFDVLFAGLAELPAGTTVEYSTAVNPCRPEVLANNPGCVDDWTTTAPADPAEVTALKFSVAGAQPAGSFLRFGIDTTVSGAEPGATAWNSAAADATQNGLDLLPFESGNVGLQIPGEAPVPATFVKTVDAATAVSGDTLTYTLTATNPNRDPMGVTVFDILPVGVEVVSASPAPTLTFPAGTFPDAGEVYFWGNDGSLIVPGRGTVEITVTVTVSAGAEGSTLVNFGSATDNDTGEGLEVTDGACTVLDTDGSCAETVITTPPTSTPPTTPAPTSSGPTTGPTTTGPTSSGPTTSGPTTSLIPPTSEHPPTSVSSSDSIAVSETSSTVAPPWTGTPPATVYPNQPLPDTGVALTTWLTSGLILLLLGAATVLLARRRTKGTHV